MLLDSSITPNAAQQTKPQSLSLESHTNADSDTDNSNNSFKVYKLENTPFTVINNEGKWIAAMGDYVVTQPKETEKQLLTYLKRKPWEVIMAVQIAMMDIEKKKTESAQQMQ